MGEIEHELRQWEIRIMLWLKWKLAFPLLYDEVLNVAQLWDQFTLSLLPDFPLRFETDSRSQRENLSYRESLSQTANHNFLATNICICLYNFNHLIAKTPFEALSHRIRRLALAIFLVLIRTFPLTQEN